MKLCELIKDRWPEKRIKVKIGIKWGVGSFESSAKNSPKKQMPVFDYEKRALFLNLGSTSFKWRCLRRMPILFPVSLVHWFVEYPQQRLDNVKKQISFFEQLL